MTTETMNVPAANAEKEVGTSRHVGHANLRGSQCIIGLGHMSTRQDYGVSVLNLGEPALNERRTLG